MRVATLTNVGTSLGRNNFKTQNIFSNTGCVIIRQIISQQTSSLGVMAIIYEKIMVILIIDGDLAKKQKRIG